MSDVWAMGGKPELGLAFVGFPTDKLSNEILGEVMAGLSEAAARAGCAIVGGHTISDAEPKAGSPSSAASIPRACGRSAARSRGRRSC